MTSRNELEKLSTIIMAKNMTVINDITHCFNVIDRDLEALEIIKNHKLLNYVLKNKKCANMYKLTDDELELLKESMGE